MIIEKPSRTYAWFHDVTTLDIEVNRGEGIGAHKVLAGSPIDENGNIANDETAVGLLMETVSDTNPDGKIIVAGDVDALGAKNASGIELSDAAKNALSGITWREPDYVVEMPTGGGGGAFTVEVRFGEDNLIFNHTYAEIDEAKTKISAYIVYPDGAAFPLSVHVTGGVAYFSRIGEIDTVNNTASFFGYVIYEDGTTEYVEKYISLTD